MCSALFLRSICSKCHGEAVNLRVLVSTPRTLQLFSDAMDQSNKFWDFVIWLQSYWYTLQPINNPYCDIRASRRWIILRGIGKQLYFYTELK